MEKKCAQSTLEYIMVIVAVIASIMVMGPYVFRGVNAYMRSWEISAEQAQHDTSARIESWEVPGAEPPPPPPPPSITCSDYNNDESLCCSYQECLWVTNWHLRNCVSGSPQYFCKNRAIYASDCNSYGGDEACCCVITIGAISPESCPECAL